MAAAFCFWTVMVSFGQPAAAQLNEEQVQQYISSFGWTMNDLQQYLADYDMKLADFATLDELKQWLGAPITEENLNELLTRHQLTKEELEALLGQFGETLQDYTFIEDLDTAVNFYLHHNQEMQQVNDMLSAIGFTEQEANRLFEHIMSLNEAALTEKLAGLDKRIEPFLRVEDPTELTKQQQDELLSVWEDLLSALEIKPKFYLVKNGQKQEVPYRNLLHMETLGGRDLLIEMYNLQGDLLADMQLSEEMLKSGYIVRAGESFVHAGEIGGEMKEKMQGDKMPNTASPYLSYMLMGVALTLFGAILYWRKRERTAE
nr:processed acidic surface protein [Anoxybacillus tepidamans]